MSYRRHIDTVLETPTSITFSLVVRDAATDSVTYGGGWVVVPKPINDVQLRNAVDDAVDTLVRNGNGVYAKKAPPGSGEVATGPQGRLIKEHGRLKDLEDWPSGRRDNRGHH